MKGSMTSLPLERYQLRHSPRNARWSVFKFTKGIGFRKEAELAFILTKRTQFKSKTDKPIIESLGIVGFSSEFGCAHWMASHLKLELFRGHEIVLSDDTYTWGADGGSVTFADLCILEPDGAIYNLIPKEYIGEEE